MIPYQPQSRDHTFRWQSLMLIFVINQLKRPSYVTKKIIIMFDLIRKFPSRKTQTHITHLLTQKIFVCLCEHLDIFHHLSTQTLERIWLYNFYFCKSFCILNQDNSLSLNFQHCNTLDNF